MSNGKFVLEEVKARGSEMFGKMRGIFGDKVTLVKSISEEPEFLGCDNPKMHLASDGTKGCFMFRGTNQAKEFAEALSKRLEVKTDVDSYIGYGVVYVPADKYEEAIQKGLNMHLLKINGGCWLNFYNERSSCENEQILVLKPHSVCFDNHGKLKKMEEVIIRTWLKSLESVLGQEIFVAEDFMGRKTIEVGIKRTMESHLMHDSILGTIRSSELLKNSLFEGYAYVDYYGKYVR